MNAKILLKLVQIVVSVFMINIHYQINLVVFSERLPFFYIVSNFELVLPIFTSFTVKLLQIVVSID